jgi:predicted protein tyrosine phosphatase
VSKVLRPQSIREHNHLVISMDDIIEEADGFTAPALDHVERVLAFGRSWDRTAPMVIHCYAGISRSTASAFAVACALNPNRSELEIARRIRDASPFAHPNRLIVTHADRLLGRAGRMLRALDEMGPGNLTVEGYPFHIDLD